MLRFALLLPFCLVSLPVIAEDELTPAQLAEQNQAIAASVQEQLLACWSLPPGYENREIQVRLVFLGDGALDDDPYIVPDSIRTAGKYPELMQSIVRAIETCLPFAGLEELGALAGERFDITVRFSN